MAGKLIAKPAKELAPIKFTEIDKLFDRTQETYRSIARRAFELFEGKGRISGHDLEDWLRAESELLHPIHITINESEKGFKVQAEVPGFSAKELEASVEPRRLTITGQRETKGKHEKGKTIYSERCANQILRVIDLPAEVDPAKATATLKDGILDFNIPKAIPAKKVRTGRKAASHFVRSGQ
ncbi:MAG: Hsp20 family protein [Acidobacteria bacterium]|nr:Hsp20 family protein [Acidobacteriota bacterium]